MKIDPYIRPHIVPGKPGNVGHFDICQGNPMKKHLLIESGQNCLLLAAYLQRIVRLLPFFIIMLLWMALAL